MAVIAGNLELADVIQFHKAEDIGEQTLRTRLKGEIIIFCPFSAIQGSSQVQPPAAAVGSPLADNV